MRDFLRFTLLSCAVGLFGCASTVIDESSHYTLEFVQAGGFAGVSATTSLDNETKVISFSDGHGVQKGELTDADITALSHALNVADIPGSAGPYKCGECADQFTDEAHLVLDGSAYDSEWDFVPTSPPRLLALSREMQALAQQKFAPRP